MTDHYKTLGLDKNASPEQIKSQYRKLAGKHHPDKGGDTAKFQTIQQAYDVLSDPNRRQQYDFGGMDGPGFPGSGFPGNPFQDMVDQFHRQSRQRVYTIIVPITLEQVYAGSSENVHIQSPTGTRVANLRIPVAIEDGQQVRYDGIMEDGWLQVTFRIKPHPLFTRKGLDIHLTKHISVFDLIVGTEITVTSLSGKSLEIKIPPRTKPGSQFRLSGYGLEVDSMVGDQYVLIQGSIPDIISEELMNLINIETKKDLTQ